MKNKQKSFSSLPMILVILDGWGLAKPNKGNAVTLSDTPTMDGISKKYPFTELHAYGRYVGLPPKQDGNSEAGHMNIGAGRVVEQDAVKISKSINDGTFFKNTALMEAIKNAKTNKSKMHLMGMLSNGMSAHSEPDHILALLTLLEKNKVDNVYLHLFTDGRDSPKYAALKLVEDMERSFKNKEKVATIIGRFYAMDRTKKWERTKMAYEALLLGKGHEAKNARTAISESYNKGDNDEFIEPYIIDPAGRIEEGDSVIFFNLRSDRARQLAKVFVQKNFNEDNPGSFKRAIVLKNLCFVAMTDFGPDLDSIMSAFPSVDLKQTLPMVLSDMKQLYLAETEKYAHVTYFFNGGYSGRVNGEDQAVIASPDVKSYDATPAMKTRELTETVIHSLEKRKYDFILLNFAAPDMIGHTGNLEAGIRCCHEVDKCLGRIVKAYLGAGGTVVITADHGNIEEMINLETEEIDTEHSTNPVPFVIVNKKYGGSNKIKLKDDGVLGDIAPTILELMGRKKPKEMSGESLIK
ncbi:MAG: 2,3-bisphosphoglycerate-independent phosphoglycerate mutase [Patescibacteria group bacterium]|nr:2,3-bisphosphoglycerate-independent phosphoglycerate mutase [Patescibacteria group bacterium]